MLQSRVHFRSRLSLASRWLSGALLMACLLAVGMYVQNDIDLPRIQIKPETQNLKPGQSLRLEVNMQGIVPREGEIWDFYLYLPPALKARFVPGSMRFLGGSAEGSSVRAYSGKDRLQIEDLRSDSLRFEITLQIPDDLSLAERSFPLHYGVKINEEAYACERETDVLEVGYEPFQLTHRLLKTPSPADKRARYELLLQNPAEGLLYNPQNGLICLMAYIHHPGAKVVWVGTDDGMRSEPIIHGNTFNIEAISLAPGASLLLHYEVEYPDGKAETHELNSTATAFVPTTAIRAAAQGQIELPAVKWHSFTAVDSLGHFQLRWYTLEEVNNKGFYVEKSDNGLAFETLAFVPGQGNTVLSHQYQYTTEAQAAGRYYLRLRQEGFDGNIHFSETLLLRSQWGEPFVLDFTESAQKAELMVQLPQHLRIEIRSTLGETLAVVFDGLMQSQTPYLLDLAMSEFSEGDYLFWMEGEYFQERRLFIRRRGKWRQFV